MIVTFVFSFCLTGVARHLPDIVVSHTPTTSPRRRNQPVPYVLKSKEEQKAKAQKAITKAEKKFNALNVSKIGIPIASEHTISPAMITMVPTPPSSPSGSSQSFGFTRNLDEDFSGSETEVTKSPIEVNLVETTNEPHRELRGTYPELISDDPSKHRRSNSCPVDISDYSEQNDWNISNNQPVIHRKISQSEEQLSVKMQERLAQIREIQNVVNMESNETSTTLRTTGDRILSRLRHDRSKLRMTWDTPRPPPPPQSLHPAVSDETQEPKKGSPPIQEDLQRDLIMQRVGADLRLIADQFEENNQVNILSNSVIMSYS